MVVTTCDIFISYRRRFAGDAAGRLYAELQHQLAARVFMDTESINPGERFADRLGVQLEQCRVLLVLIDHAWHDCWHGYGSTNQSNQEDWVLREIKTILERGDVHILPVLLDGAAMPRDSDLPVSIRTLSEYQAVHLRQDTYRADVAVLINHLLRLLSNDRPTNTWANKVLVAAFVAILASVVFLLISKPSFFESKCEIK